MAKVKDLLFKELRRGLMREVTGDKDQRKGLYHWNVVVVCDTCDWDTIFIWLFLITVKYMLNCN